MVHNMTDIVESLRSMDTYGYQSQLACEAADEIELLRQTVEDQRKLYANCVELAKDAERYRWLRDINEDPELYLETEPEMLDAAIDTAMKGEK